MFDRRVAISQGSAGQVEVEIFDADLRTESDRRGSAERRSGARRNGQRGAIGGDRRRTMFSRRSTGFPGH